MRPLVRTTNGAIVMGLLALILLGVAGLAILDNNLRGRSCSVAIEELQGIVNSMARQLCLMQQKQYEREVDAQFDTEY